MSLKHRYIVSCVNHSFKSLDNVKFHIEIAFTREEAKKYLVNEEICHFIGDKLHSVTPIKVDEYGNVSFGKTRKFI